MQRNENDNANDLSHTNSSELQHGHSSTTNTEFSHLQS